MARLLLVEDDIALLSLLTECMFAAGHEVQTAGSGETALNILLHLDDEKPELIVADINLPGISGLEMMRFIREEQHYREIPCLLISANMTDDIREQIEGIDAATYLPKPFSIVSLWQAVERALQKV